MCMVTTQLTDTCYYIVISGHLIYFDISSNFSTNHSLTLLKKIYSLYTMADIDTEIQNKDIVKWFKDPLIIMK